MSVLTAPPSLIGGHQSFRRFSVDEYHRMIDADILNEQDKVELLDGYVVLKMPRNPPHDSGIDLVQASVRPLLPSGWFLRCQQAITLKESEPEPDIAAVRGNPRSFSKHNPQPADVGMLIEVSESSLARDQLDRGKIYASANIAWYWIVNLVDARVEVYSAPSGPTAQPSYAQRQDYRAGDLIPLVLDGVTVGHVAAVDLLP